MKSKIFVTVGNGKFDHLVSELDKLKEKDLIEDDITIQLGHGNYKPKFCQWFKFENDLNKYYEQANMIISHGGPGTVFEILRQGKKLIAVPNRDRTDPHHQVEYLQAMAKETSALLYCDRVKDIHQSIEKAKKHNFTKYQQPSNKIPDVIKKILES